jgi:hypothetical protein
MENMFYALIPLAPFIVASLWIWTSHQRKLLEKQSAMTAEKAAQYAAHTERLEARVRVLERLATERGADLASEIDALRDRPVN